MKLLGQHFWVGEGCAVNESLGNVDTSARVPTGQLAILYGTKDRHMPYGPKRRGYPSQSLRCFGWRSTIESRKFDNEQGHILASRSRLTEEHPVCRKLRRGDRPFMCLN